MGSSPQMLPSRVADTSEIHMAQRIALSGKIELDRPQALIYYLEELPAPLRETYENSLLSVAIQRGIDFKLSGITSERYCCHRDVLPLREKCTCEVETTRSPQVFKIECNLFGASVLVS